MIITQNIYSDTSLQVRSFVDSLAVEGLQYKIQQSASGSIIVCMWNEESTSYFVIEEVPEGYRIMMSKLAAYKDLQLFPYLVDSLASHLEGKVDGLHPDESVYSRFNEAWIESTIADGIAKLKALLVGFPCYWPNFSFGQYAYIDLNVLGKVGVTLHSATPRIYGYLQYLMQADMLPQMSEKEYNRILKKYGNKMLQINVPQHTSIGRVKSWQLDGSVTWESYSEEDVVQLLQLAKAHHLGEEVLSVVLNDLGTIHQEGIGVERDEVQAIYWFEQAIQAGDLLFAPTNLGDLYRKGGWQIEASLEKALAAYRQSEDPYAFYRIGQSYEEGWVSEPDLQKAIKWYKVASDAGHHLAQKRLRTLGLL